LSVVSLGVQLSATKTSGANRDETWASSAPGPDFFRFFFFQTFFGAFLKNIIAQIFDFDFYGEHIATFNSLAILSNASFLLISLQ